MKRHDALVAKEAAGEDADDEDDLPPPPSTPAKVPKARPRRPTIPRKKDGSVSKP